MKSVTRIAFPLIALASAVFTSCGGGGGGEGESSDYVSIKQFESGRGFTLWKFPTVLTVSPGTDVDPKIGDSLQQMINDNTQGLDIPSGDVEQTYIQGGTLKIQNGNNDIIPTTSMDYFVVGGSTGHGILFMSFSSDGSGDLQRIRDVFSLEASNIRLKKISITVDFNFSSHEVTLYFKYYTETNNDNNPHFNTIVFTNFHAN